MLEQYIYVDLSKLPTAQLPVAGSVIKLGVCPGCAQTT